MATLNRAAPETQLDVDLLILDYLLYMGTRTLLQEQVILREEGVQENLSQQPMRMIDCTCHYLVIIGLHSDNISSLYPSLQVQSPDRSSPGGCQLQASLDQIHLPLQQTQRAVRSESSCSRDRKASP